MTGTAPDITMLGGTWCVEFMEMDAFAPIEDYVSQELIDTFIPSGFDIMTGLTERFTDCRGTAVPGV